jgi:hypothetical protein
LPSDEAYQQRQGQGGGQPHRDYYAGGAMPNKKYFTPPAMNSFSRQGAGAFPVGQYAPGAPRQQQQGGNSNFAGRGSANDYSTPGQRLPPNSNYNAQPGASAASGYGWLHNDAENSFRGREPSWTQPKKFF